MDNSSRWQWMKDELQQLGEQSQLRRMVPTSIGEDGWLVREGRRMLNLASNHYLGLPLLPAQELSQQADSSSEVEGRRANEGATASRLIVGSDPIYAAFEAEFAAFKETEASLVFGSGYTANVGIISALMGRHDAVFSDRLNHASIVDGITLSRARHVRYRNRDMEHLEYLLKQAEPSRRKLIVTDSVFSMDGSIAPLQELVRLKERYQAMLMVDEAHSGGVYGAEGQGLVHELGLSRAVDIQMGTFSKAYGSYGAYAAGDHILINYLVNKSR
ncbi:MAG: 8-amino-7-oxononanoate synthase, partial [Paenibacillus sp. RIFOXYA1_FULL_44_5]